MNSDQSNKLVDLYFCYMQNWDDETKKLLIQKLTESLNSKNSQARDFSVCFGAWKESRSAEEISNEISADRAGNREIENF